ncbi:MAG TPA: spore coat protein [Bacillota bacterium]
MTLGDRDMITDLLLCEKHLAESYNLGVIEAANRSLRERLRGLWQETQDLHAEVFHEMHRRGWYPTSTAAEHQINSVIDRWEKREHKEPSLQR